MSGGEQQMCAIGRAMMAKPRLLMLDEPSMGLAPIFVDRIFETIVEINKEGTPILLVEQNALMALDVADRGYVLQTGTIALEGDGEGASAERGRPQGVPRRRVTRRASACVFILSRPHDERGRDAHVPTRRRDRGDSGRHRVGRDRVEREDRAAGQHCEGRQDRLLHGRDVPAGGVLPGLEDHRLRRRLRRRHREADGREGGAQEHDLRLDHPCAAREEVRRDHQRHERHGRAPEAGRLRRLPEDRPVDHRAEGEPEARVVARQPVRASACRSSRGRRTATS